ncbi:MAG: zinc ribbon domain-containing protein [Candidatus Hydrothermia bacterium]|nr:zinc ribbon domain-containing protein [Candidatus Hydrothermia bacterium]MDD5572819.1 zinc ribbon domain-containing protein [Candidatus Hydrothermia bacterium]
MALKTLCQSCGTPFTKESEFGTNRDGTKNYEYCINCYKDGRFTDPDITLEEMIEKVAKDMIENEKIPSKYAYKIAKEYIPGLKRWSKV